MAAVVARVQLNIRLPADLHTAMSDLAQREIRSLNGQIELALRQWLEWRPLMAQGKRDEVGVSPNGHASTVSQA